MNQFIISIALVAAIAGVASANLKSKHHRHSSWEEEEDCCLDRHYRPHHSHHDSDEGEFIHGPGVGFGHGPVVFPGHGGHGHGHGPGHSLGLGHGHGHGHGSGHGLGHGSGHGLGHGSGHGLGHGLGHGPGHGLSHGSGHGLGHGFGHGSGPSFGSESGSGHGLGGQGGKFNHGGLRPQKGRKGKHFGKHHQRPFPVHHRRPHGAIGGGAIGALRGQEGHLNGLQSGTHLGSNDVIEGHKGNLKGGHADIDFDQHRGDTDEIESIRKHQVVNTDKTFINDKTSGINDVDGFRSTDSRTEDSHLGADIGGFSGSESGGSIKKSKDFDQELELINAGESSIEAAGAKGAGAVF